MKNIPTVQMKYVVQFINIQTSQWFFFGFPNQTIYLYTTFINQCAWKYSNIKSWEHTLKFSSKSSAVEWPIYWDPKYRDCTREPVSSVTQYLTWMSSCLRLVVRFKDSSNMMTKLPWLTVDRSSRLINGARPNRARYDVLSLPQVNDLAYSESGNIARKTVATSSF